jgi:hypothetical protein
MSVFMITVVRSGFIVRHRFYALVGLLSLRQFPVHWERNENKHAISKAYRMGSILWLAGLELDHRPNPAWLCLLRQPPPRLGHAIQLCTQQPKRSPLMPGASSELQLLTPAKRPLLARPCRFGSKADIRRCLLNVRFAPESGHRPTRRACPLSANKRHAEVCRGAYRSGSGTAAAIAD